MNIKNYIVQFDLPYHIQVQDSFKNNQEKRFYPVIDDVPAEIRFQSNQEDSGGVAVAGTAAGDRHGRLGYSSVQVWFDYRFMNNIPDDIDEEKPIDADPVFHMGQPRGTDRFLIENALKYINKFLSVYRSITGFYWITSISPHEVIRFIIAENMKDGSQDRRTVFYTTSSLKSGPLDEDKLTTIQSGVQMETPVTIFDELDLDADDKIDRGDYNASIIDSAIMFESWVKSAFQEVAMENGYSREEAQEMIKKGGDSDEFMSPKNIIKDKFPEFGYDFTTQEEFTHWDERTRKVRNKVVHEGYQATFSEAKQAKDSTIKALSELSKGFKDSLEGTIYYIEERDDNILRRPDDPN